jgi:hypothetical protein
MKRDRRQGAQLAICAKNKGYRASLEVRKFYQVLPDASAAAQGQLRIRDESGEDYLYPEEYFVLVKLPHKIEEALQLVC